MTDLNDVAKTLAILSSGELRKPDRFDLAALSDAHVRALLDPDYGDVEAWLVAKEAGLVADSDTPDDERDKPDGSLTKRGLALLTEAHRIADGLTDDEARTLVAGNEWLGWDDPGKRMVKLGLLRSQHHDDEATGGYSSRHQTPLGKLVLALRERRREIMAAEKV